MPAPRVGPLRAGLHLAGLWALAFVLPLFNLVSGEPGFLVAHGSTPGDIVALAAAYALVPPLAATLAVAVAGRLRPALGQAVLLVLVAVLVAALVLPVAGDLLGGSSAALPVALAGGALGALAYARWAAVRSTLSVLGAAPVLLLAHLLLLSPVAELVRGGEASGSVAGPARSSTPIILVILDELPLTTLTDARGRLDAARFPNLARFAGNATWYRHATTVADVTLEAVPAQFTGEWPHVGDLPTTRDHPRSLFTLFGRSHELTVMEPITDVCPDRLCAEDGADAGERRRVLADDAGVIVRHLLLPAALRRRLPAIDRTWAGFASDDDGPVSRAQASRVRSRLGKSVGAHLRTNDARAGFAVAARAAVAPHRRPPLIVLHSTLPHAPWRYLPDGRRYALHPGDPPGLEGLEWLDRQWLVDQAFQRHLLQVQDVDRMLGRLLDALHRGGLYDRAVVVVTADHGASFTASEPRRVVTRANFAEVAGVPFLVKVPGQRRGRVADGAVRTFDVLPTIAKAAGVRVPWPTAGRPADERPVDAGAAVRVTHAGGPGAAAPLATVLRGEARRRRAVARVLGHGVEGVGPRPDLLGRRVPAGAPDPGGAPATVDAPTLPALVRGRVDGLPADAVVALAVGGRVVATTRTYPDADGMRYQALLTRSGRGRVTVLEVLPGDRLRPLGRSGPVRSLG